MQETDKRTLGEIVAQRRRSLNMSQAALAIACQVSERTIIRIESGSRPAPETLMAVCSVLSIPPEAARAASPSAPGSGRAAATRPARYGAVIVAAAHTALAIAIGATTQEYSVLRSAPMLAVATMLTIAATASFGGDRRAAATAAAATGAWWAWAAATGDDELAILLAAVAVSATAGTCAAIAMACARAMARTPARWASAAAVTVALAAAAVPQGRVAAAFGDEWAAQNLALGRFVSSWAALHAHGRTPARAETFEATRTFALDVRSGPLSQRRGIEVATLDRSVYERRVETALGCRGTPEWSKCHTQAQTIGAEPSKPKRTRAETIALALKIIWNGPTVDEPTLM